MKPTLVLGLGNRLMGDDGVGCYVADRLAADPAVQTDAEVVAGGTDVLRLADDLKGRQRLFVIDAALDDAPPGTVSVLSAHHLDEPDHGSRQAHSISPVETLQLLRAVGALQPRTELTLLTVSIGSVQIHDGLSPALSQALPAITQRVRDLIASGS